MTHAESRQRNERMREYARTGKTYREVAERFGVHRKTAAAICKGLCARQPQSPHVDATDFSGVDWTLNDAAIGRQLGLSKEWIRRVRRDAHLPDSPMKRRKLGTPRQADRLTAALGDDVCRIDHYCLSAADVMRATGARQLAVVETLVSHGVTLAASERKHPWHAMDWSLPNADLNRIWNMGVNSAGNCRSRARLAGPTFDIRGRRGHPGPAYLAAVAAERDKAAAWRRERAELLTRLAARYAATAPAAVREAGAA